MEITHNGNGLKVVDPTPEALAVLQANGGRKGWGSVWFCTENVLRKIQGLPEPPAGDGREAFTDVQALLQDRTGTDHPRTA